MVDLRCYAEREEDGSWFALCLDLNLYSRGDSFDEAKAKLDRLVGGYLKEALTKDKEHFHALVPRHAPRYFKRRYSTQFPRGSARVRSGYARRFHLRFPGARMAASKNC